MFFLCLFQQKFIGGSKNIGLDLFPDAMAAILDFLEFPPWVISPKSFIVCPDLPIYDCFYCMYLKSLMVETSDSPKSLLAV